MKQFGKWKLALTSMAMCAGMAAHAQDDGVIRLLVGFPPGGSTDSVARVLADRLRPELGKSVIVENKPGAGGRLAASEASRSEPNGTTYVVMPNASAVMLPIMYSPDVLKYDQHKDLTPVALLVDQAMGMAVNSSLNVDNAKAYVELVKKDPRKGFFGTAGADGQTAFTGIQLGKVAGIETKVVPYKGNGPMVIDLVGGQIPAGIGVAGDFMIHVKEGKLKLIGIFGNERSPLLPDVPTFKEQGFNVGTGGSWTGMWAPSGTPKAELDKMQAALKKVLSQKDVQELFAASNLVANFKPANEVKTLIDTETAYWAPIIKESWSGPAKP